VDAADQRESESMSYKKVQFIAYRIYTCPAHNPDRYVGLNDEADDVHQRVKLMAEAISNAAESKEVNRSSDVLKVFIAPEFYFHSMWGAYTELRYFSGGLPGRDPDSVVGALAEVVKDERWKDWLFVFGTTVVAASMFSLQDFKDPLTGRFSSSLLDQFFGRTAALNIAFVQKGGYDHEDQRVAKAIAIVKEHKSPIDYLKGQGTVVGLTDAMAAHYPAVGPGTYALEVNTPGGTRGGGYNGGSIFMLDNIVYGLEVCLDHGKARLRRASPQAGDIFVQLQLIPSGGITIDPSCVATLKGGLVCNVDGYYDGTTTHPGTQYGFHSQLYQVASVAQPTALSDMNELPRAVTTRAHADLDEVKKVFWLPPNNDVTDDKTWTPDLVIYASADIPEPQAAIYL
jgi:hypothetical protein